MSSTPANTSRKRKLFILEFELHKLTGHYFNQLLGFKRAAESAGLDVELFVPADCLPSVSNALDARAVIARLPEMPAGTSEFDQLTDNACRISGVWAELEKRDVSADDIVLMTSARPPVIYGLGIWLGRLADEARPAVVFGFYHCDYLDLETMTYTKRSELYRFVARDLTLRGIDRRVFFTVNNPTVITCLERLCWRKVFYVPMAMYYGDIVPEPARHQPTVYVHIGWSALPYLEIKDVFRRVMRRNANVRFLFKYAIGYGWPDELSSDLAAEGGELFPPQQSHDAYLQTLARADIIVLPYRAEPYKGLTSGVFAEGVAFAKIMVVPEKTWMADHIASGLAAGVTFSNTADDLVAGIEDALRRLPSLRNDATARAEPFRREHSSAQNLARMMALGSQQTETRLCYELGDKIHFNNDFDCRRYMGGGWAMTEPSGVWTLGEIAELSLPLNCPEDHALQVQVLAAPFFGRKDALDVRIEVNQMNAGAWHLKSSNAAMGAPMWLEFAIPSLGARRDTLSIRFVIDRPQSPWAAGMSEDRRELGLMFHEMIVGDAAPVAKNVLSSAARRH